MQTDQLLLIDLSSLAHPLFHISASEPDPNWTSTQVVARVRALSSQHPHTAICCDGKGKTFRHDLAPTYKANRPERDARLYHQIDVAIERLRADSYPVWQIDGVEADDIIASAVTLALGIADSTVLIASADKDLLQLVGPRVTVKSTSPQSDGKVLDADGVRLKFGVGPADMLDYLSLVGDSSDNIKGADGIGPKNAARLLIEHESIDGIYLAMAGGVVPGITPALRTSLKEFQARWPLVRKLIALKDDVPIPFAEIAAEKEAKPMTEEAPMGELEYAAEQGIDPEPEPVVGPVHRVPNMGHNTYTPSKQADGAVVAYREAAPRAELMPASADFSLQLEPRSMPEAKQLAQMMFESRLFSAYGTPQAVLSTIMAGRELGFPAMASLRAFHLIENRPCMSADTLSALVLKSGKAKFFRCTQRTPESATFTTQRTDDDAPITLTYSIEEAKQAWKKDTKAWDMSGWGRIPADMLVARAKSKLARLVFPDVVGGLYAVEEFE